jgi:hypothetical protein
MATWNLEEPQTLEFERVTSLRVRTIRGRLSVVTASLKPPSEAGRTPPMAWPVSDQHVTMPA